MDENCMNDYIYPDPEIHGWMHNDAIQWLYRQAQEYRYIVEVGSAFGRSSHALLSGNWAGWGGQGRVYCVDCWPKKREEDNHYMESTKDVLRRKRFVESLWNFSNLSIVELSSDMAYKALPDVDMVFIDGSTELIPRDLYTWFKTGARMFCGHDYCGKYPNVMKAVESYCESLGFKFELVGGKSSIWYVERPEW